MDSILDEVSCIHPQPHLQIVAASGDDVLLNATAMKLLISCGYTKPLATVKK